MPLNEFSLQYTLEIVFTHPSFRAYKNTIEILQLT